MFGTEVSTSHATQQYEHFVQTNVMWTFCRPSQRLLGMQMSVDFIERITLNMEKDFLKRVKECESVYRGSFITAAYTHVCL